MPQNAKIYVGGRVSTALKGEFMRELKRMNQPTSGTTGPRITQTDLLSALLAEGVEHRRAGRVFRTAA